jgi:hypothetical protein
VPTEARGDGTSGAGDRDGVGPVGIPLPASRGGRTSLLRVVVAPAETPRIARFSPAFGPAVPGAFAPLESQAERAELPLRHAGERSLSGAAVANACHGEEAPSATFVPGAVPGDRKMGAGSDGRALGRPPRGWQVACSIVGAAATLAAPEAFMVAFRMTLLAALAFLACSPVDAARLSSASLACRPRVARSRRPARQDPEAGEFVHAISRGSHRQASFIERA